MLTPTHGFLASVFSLSLKRRWSSKEHFFLFFGAVLPDMPVILVGVIEFFKYIAVNPTSLEWLWIKKRIFEFLFLNEHPPLFTALFTSVGYYEFALWLRQCFHSVPFWILILVVAFYLAPRTKAVSILAYGALFFHILVDWPTHVKYAPSYFWPIIDVPIPGFVPTAHPLLIKLELIFWFFWFLFVATLTYSKLRARGL